MFEAKMKMTLPSQANALPGRSEPIVVSEKHYVNGNKMLAPFPARTETIIFGLGCFWGAERIFWEIDGVYSTAAGYTAGYTQNPSYEEVCSGQTGHNEVIRVVFDPQRVDLQTLLKKFWEGHNPTQGMGQGNDKGTQYRSGIYTCNKTQFSVAEQSLRSYAVALNTSGFPDITTEIIENPDFYYAEDYHQQYLAKNPGGYCGLGGTGVSYLEI